MVKSMYSGVAGLKAHQSKMDVIGNNIANVNTWGYKAMDTSFKESIYQTVTQGSEGSTNDGGYGGVNPSMVGYGSMVSAISANFTAGTPVPTGHNLDCFIDGTAFFAVGPMYGEGDAKAPGELSMTRVGDFGIRNNFLVDGNGRYVYGFSMAAGGASWKEGATKTQEKTENQVILGAVPRDDTSKWNATKNTGTKYEYTASATAGMMEITKTTGVFMDLPTTMADGTTPLDPNTATLAEIQAAIAHHYPDVTTNPTKTYTYDATEKKMVCTTVDKSKKNLPLPSSTSAEIGGNTVTTAYVDNGKNDGTCTKVVTTVTPAPDDAQYKGPVFDDGRMVQDPETGGYKMADGVDDIKPLKIPTSCTYYDDAGILQTEEDIEFSSYTINNQGLIYGTSSTSGRSYLLGAVALVTVPNPNGMNKNDGPYYQTGGSSGAPVIGQAGGDTGSLLSGYLESANVDIATEFSNMITTQRGFQANSKIITVTDEMLQELVNMKR